MYQKNELYARTGSCSGAVCVAMLVVSASDIDTVGTIDQLGARGFSLSCSGILHYYALRGSISSNLWRGSSRRCERAVHKEGRRAQQTAVQVPSVGTQFLKNILCQMYGIFGHTGPSSDTCVRKNTEKVCIMQ